MADNEPLLQQTSNNSTIILDKQSSATMTTSSFSSDEAALADHYALDIIKGHFLRDFDMRDVLPCLQDIFSKPEEQYINAHLQCDNECTQNDITDIQDVLGEEKASRLFAVLRNKNYAQIRKFMEVLSSDYLWLVSHFDNVNKVDHSNYVDLVHSLHSKVSLKYEDYNVHRSMPYRKLRKALLTMPMQGRVILASDFGYGKKWLAVDVCTDFDVALAMNFQIYWIDMSECTSALDDLRMLRYLKLLLTQSSRSPSPAGYGSLERPDQNAKSFKNSIDEYKHLVGQELRKNSHEKCLVVLVNVRNTHALEVFDLPCKLLVLTRSKKVSDSFAKKRSTTIRLTNGLTRAEFYMLFEKYLGQQNLLEKYDLIYAHSNEHPYLLSLIGQSLRQNLANLQDWIDKLRESKFVDDKFNAAIEKSLDSLEPELRRAFMKTFSCFPHAIYVPQRLIAVLWPAGKCEKDLEKLYRHGFLEKFISPHVEICYKQLFVYGKTKQNDEVSAADMTDMHKKLLNYYHLVEDLAARSEVLPFRRDVHDFYFFSCIGYHINKSGLTDYFRQLYLDFGFLEQKIRNVDLLSTIADLETYQEYIAVDLETRKLLRALLKFLPNIEKTLQESSNTTLLQCAFMEDDLVGIEARKQAAAFPNFAWFEQHGCIHQRQNIVPLPSAPKKVLLLDQERSLIALQESSAILLINITFDWNTYTVKLKEPTRGKSNVVDIRFFRDNNSYILLALYDNGNMNVWSLQGDCTMYRRRSHSFARPAEKEIECRNFIPIDHLLKPITAFDFTYGVNPNPSNLYLAYKTGEIRCIDWNSENEIFVPAPYPSLKTGMPDICLLRIVFSRNYIVCNKAGDICIFDVLDYSHLRGIETFKHLIDTIELTRNELLLICRRCIVHFTSKSINETGEPNYLLQERDLTADDAHNAINCAKLLHINGHKQLLLGTKTGLIMFDIETRTKVLTTNVNEDITCVDIQLVDVVKNKYIVACGSNAHRFLNLFALRTNAAGRPLLSWSGSSKTLRTKQPYLDLQMPPYVSLKGGKLYTAQYVHDAPTLLAVDSHNQLHEIDASGHSRVYERAPDIITAITQYGDRSFISCANGVLVYLSLHATSPAAMQQVFTEQPIEFLQLLDEHTLIVAGANEFVVFTNLNYGVCKRLPMLANRVMCCFRLKAGQILILFINRAFSVLDESANLIYNYVPQIPASIGGCDLQNNQLFIVTENYKIEIFDLAKSLGPKQPDMIYNGGDTFRGARVSCIAVSRKANLLAVACYTMDHNGENDTSIHVYDCQLHAKRIDLLYTLNGHSQRINSMRFSPNAYVLVSCAEQLCWWSMHMAACKLNNAVADTTTQHRRSGFTRFLSDSSEDEETLEEHISVSKLARILEDVSLQARNDTRPSTDVTPVDDVVDFTMVTGGVDAIWKSKCGPATNCELLACVKFNGNEALQFFANEAFTKFQTIDNGGSYYVLTLHDFNAPLETCESVVETSNAVADCDVVT